MNECSYKFPLSIAFAAFQEFWYDVLFLFVSKCLLISFVISFSCIGCLGMCCLIPLQICEFSSFLLLLISRFIPLWSERMVCTISIFSIYGDFLWPSIWSVLRMDHMCIGKNMYSTIVRWSDCICRQDKKKKTYH